MNTRFWDQPAPVLRGDYTQPRHLRLPPPKPAKRLHPDTPLCAFCWPKWSVSTGTEPTYGLPCCPNCTHHEPQVPSFLWDQLRQAARSAFDGVPM